MTRVAVTGLGIVCSLGNGVAEVWSALKEGRRGFGPLTLFEADGVAAVPVAQACGFEPDPRARSVTRLDRMIAAAAGEAVATAGLGGPAALAEFGVALGTSNGGMLEAEGWLAREIARERGDRPGAAGRPPWSAAPVVRGISSSISDALAALYGARGPRLTNTTACSSSAGSIASAAERIRDGDAPGMIAGGGDPLCRLTYAGFGSLRLMDPAGCRPFDAGRRGLTLGEGAGILVLEAWGRALARGARILAEVLDHGATCDAHHMTACHPEGRGMEAAMREALARSGIRPDQVGYVNAHGTATQVNDAAEGKAIARVFGGRDGASVSSSKSMFGHLLGGSGAVEAVAAILAILRGAVPPNAGLARPGEGIDLDLISGCARPARVGIAASNSFGFGGGNVVLLFAAAEEAP